MKYVIGAGVFVALALVAKFLVLLRFGVDIYVHDTYWVIPIRKIAFWSLMGWQGSRFLLPFISSYGTVLDLSAFADWMGYYSLL